jgi:hypothetical protein
MTLPAGASYAEFVSDRFRTRNPAHRTHSPLKRRTPIAARSSAVARRRPHPNATGVSIVEKNIGTQDRNIRYAAGALLILAALLNWSSFWWLGLLGVVAIGTAYMGTCMAYIPFKINTKKPGE